MASRGASRSSSQPSLRRQLLALAAQVLRATSEDRPEGAIRVTVEYVGGGTAHVETSQPGELALLRASAGLPEMQANILQALHEAGPNAEPSSRELARRAGYAYGPRFRSALRALQDLRLVRPTADGYALSLPPRQENGVG